MSNVLIVDDDAAMCAMLAKGLGRKAFHCQFRTSADEGLPLMETEAFDVVVTDLNMRAMNGLELCARIVANQPDVPVVVITAFGSIETAVGAIRAGAYDFITKPVDLKSFVGTVGGSIRELIDKGRSTAA